MKKMKIMGALIITAMVLINCASTASFKDVPPSAGTAFVCLPINVWIDHVDGERVLWVEKTRHEIAAGAHQLSVGFRYSDVYTIYSATDIILNGIFTEGKSYYVIPSVKRGKVYLNLVETSEQPQNQITLPNYKAPAFSYTQPRYSPDGSMLLVNYKNILYIYNVNDGMLVKTLTGHSKEVTTGLWSPDGTKIISGDQSGAIIIWDVSSGSEVRSIRGNKGPVSFAGLKITPDGAKILGNGGDILKIWDINDGSELFVSEKIYRWGANSFFTLSPDGQYFAATFDDNTLRVYSINGGLPIFRIAGEKRTRYFPFEFIDGNTLIAVYCEPIRIYSNPEQVSIDIKSNRTTKFESEYIPRTNLSNYNYDGSKVFSQKTTVAGNGIYYFIQAADAKTGDTVSAFSSPRVDIISFDVSPVENKVAGFTHGEGKIRFWDFGSSEN
ncbi:MAG: hypothetical protein LBB89_00615 [Treponema sp.]|jgi:WD40 repeat protein|nr:hypothetical protein [Treponema sp.]